MTMSPNIIATGQQSGSARYGPTFAGAPPIATWRANLTGLSQVHNLYFIAYGPDIHVYEPQFRTQRLSSNAVLIFTSQPSASRLQGFIDRRHPHNINNLIVDYLGTEEVVAVVRDDGDVDAFLVRHIVQAIERRAEESNSLGIQATEIRPFFQSNVGISAWGLAIHAEARILATSSNAYEVRVFKFGLAQKDEDESRSSPPQNESESSEDEEDTDRAHERYSDVTHHIINGEANIPYISFCNTGDDPEGRWLLTTDISGVCRVMDLRHLKTVQVFQFGRLLRDLGWAGFDRINAGWILMFLDRRSFQETEDVYAALGLEEKESFAAMKRNPSVWDLTKTVERLPGHEQPFVYHRRRKDGQSMRTDSSPKPETADSTTSTAEEYASSTDDESDGGAPLDTEMDSLGDDTQEGSANLPSTTANSAITSEVSSTTSDHSSINIVDDAEDPDDEMTEDTISFNAWYNGDTISYNIPHYLSSEPICEGLPCPILHASCRNTYLLQPSDPKTTSGPDLPPVVGLANPLRQKIQQDFDFLSQHQRLNMAVHIPSLGIVIIASQKGRAMVLSLSKLPASTTYPKEMLPKRHGTADPYVPSWLEKTTYAMRVECILPFAEQEKANHRPFMPLHGLAASPLQGCEVGGTPVRWRLMMMYQDHSILSYEISRSTAGTGQVNVNGVGAGLESVVV